MSFLTKHQISQIGDLIIEMNFMPYEKVKQRKSV